MLVLTREQGQKIFTDNGITITVLGIRGNQVRIGIDAPKEVNIRRDDAKQIKK
jgi:carbon storage regulator